MSGTSISQSYSFSPTQIPGCQLWFDAADSTKVTLSGSKVTQWTDKSSNAYSVSQGNDNARPTYSSNVQNGLNGISFGAGLFMFTDGSNIPNFSSGSSASVFITGRNASTNNGWNIVNTMWFNGTEGATSRYHFSFNQGGTAGTTLFANSTLTGQVTSNAVLPSANAILGFTTSPSSSSIHTNGSSNAYGGKSLTAANNSTDFMFNDARGASVGADIIIFEMVGFNTQVSTSERQQIEGYMAWKWGLQENLPSTHPYKNYPPFMNTLALPTTITAPIRGANNALFVPTQISGCQLWLDAADRSSLALTGTSVNQWRDKSGGGRNAISIGSSVPSFINNSIVFNGNGQFSTSYSSVLTNENCFLVFRINSSTTFSLISGGALGNRIFYVEPAASRWIYLGGIGVWGAFNTSALTISKRYLTNFSWTSPSTRSLFLSGSILSPLTTVGNPTAFTGTPTTSFIGNGFIGELNEVIGYNATLTTSQRQQVEGYLAWKWGLQGDLPASHPFKNSPILGVNVPPVPVLPPQIRSASWIPTLVTGCQLWLDATDINANGTSVADGSLITTWRDKSGSSRNFSGGVSPSYISNGLNKKGVVRYTTGKYLLSGSVALYSSPSSGGSFFFLFQTTNNEGQKFLLTYQNQVSGVYCQTETEIGIDTGNTIGSGNFGVHRGCSFAAIAPSTTIANSTFYIMGLLLLTTGNTPSNVNIFQNGNSLTVSNDQIGFYNAGSYPSANNSRSLVLGARSLVGNPSPDAYFTGDIAEVIWYNGPLSIVQRQQVEGYLAWKWGLVSNLPANHPFKKFPPLP
jgi:hypothetical protein